jgi:hypothetical protein
MMDDEPDPVSDSHCIVRQELPHSVLEAHERYLIAARNMVQREITRQATENLRAQQKTMQDRWNKQARELGIEVGMRVFIKRDRSESRTFPTPYDGPFEVLKIMDKGNVHS